MATLLTPDPIQQQTALLQQQEVPQMAAAQPAALPTPEQRPGPVRQLLGDLLLGFGDAARAKVGLETTAQRAQREFQQNIVERNTAASEQLRDAQAARLREQGDALAAQNAPVTFAADDASVPESLRGQTFPTLVANAFRTQYAKTQAAQKVADTAADARVESSDAKLRLAKYYNEVGGDPRMHQIRSVGGKVGLYDRQTGKLLTDLGADTAMITGPRNAMARAQANAAYGVANTLDSNGDPVAISRLDQLRTGAPTVTEQQTMNLAGDRLGATTYLGANHRVEQAIRSGVLRDNVQRGIIARATEDIERNPGAIDSIISAATQQGLSPQGADLIAAMKQMNEFGSAFKKYTGNSGAATDSLRRTIHGNQPSTANSDQVNLNLLGQDRALAAGVLQNLGRPSRHAPAAKPASAASRSSANSNDPLGIR